MAASDPTPPPKEDDLPISHLTIEARLPSLPAEIRRSLTMDEQASFFYSLVDAAADAIIAHRPDGSVVYANSEAASLLGYSEEELAGLPPYFWVAPSELSSAPRRIESILHDGCITFQSGARCKNQRVIPTEVRSRRVDTPLGPVVVAVIRDISERVASQAELQRLAFRDGLTGLPNRIRLEERLTVAIADSKRYGDLLAMAYIDLDQFKPVNDRYGHAVGDIVLVEIGRRLREEVREQDIVARLGGDEFVVVFPRLTSHAETEQLAQRLVDRVREPILADGRVVSVDASVGLAFFDAATDDARRLLVKADVAMYAAKRDPEHPWLLFDGSMGLPADADEHLTAHVPGGVGRDGGRIGSAGEIPPRP
jgi:diguanylate cyclase (GGDEF)-like protein/PAS domain S-box-containing protein